MEYFIKEDIYYLINYKYNLSMLQLHIHIQYTRNQGYLSLFKCKMLKIIGKNMSKRKTDI